MLAQRPGHMRKPETMTPEQCVENARKLVTDQAFGECAACHRVKVRDWCTRLGRWSRQHFKQDRRNPANSIRVNAELLSIVSQVAQDLFKMDRNPRMVRGDRILKLMIAFVRTSVRHHTARAKVKSRKALGDGGMKQTEELIELNRSGHFDRMLEKFFTAAPDTTSSSRKALRDGLKGGVSFIKTVIGWLAMTVAANPMGTAAVAVDLDLITDDMFESAILNLQPTLTDSVALDEVIRSEAARQHQKLRDLTADTLTHSIRQLGIDIGTDVDASVFWNELISKIQDAKLPFPKKVQRLVKGWRFEPMLAATVGPLVSIATGDSVQVETLVESRLKCFNFWSRNCGDEATGLQLKGKISEPGIRGREVAGVLMQLYAIAVVSITETLKFGDLGLINHEPLSDDTVFSYIDRLIEGSGGGSAVPKLKELRRRASAAMLGLKTTLAEGLLPPPPFEGPSDTRLTQLNERIVQDLQIDRAVAHVRQAATTQVELDHARTEMEELEQNWEAVKLASIDAIDSKRQFVDDMVEFPASDQNVTLVEHAVTTQTKTLALLKNVVFNTRKDAVASRLQALSPSDPVLVDTKQSVLQTIAVLSQQIASTVAEQTAIVDATKAKFGAFREKLNRLADVTGTGNAGAGNDGAGNDGAGNDGAGNDNADSDDEDNSEFWTLQKIAIGAATTVIAGVGGVYGWKKKMKPVEKKSNPNNATTTAAVARRMGLTNTRALTTRVVRGGSVKVGSALNHAPRPLPGPFAGGGPDRTAGTDAVLSESFGFTSEEEESADLSSGDFACSGQGW